MSLVGRHARHDQVHDEARTADVLRKVEAEARSLGADGIVIAETYRALVELSIARELDRFDGSRDASESSTNRWAAGRGAPK
jgi:chorismate mutase